MVFIGRGIGLRLFRVNSWMPDMAGWAFLLGVAGAIAVFTWLLVYRSQRRIQVDTNGVVVHSFPLVTLSASEEIEVAIVQRPWSKELVMMTRATSIRIPLREFENPSEASRVVEAIQGAPRTEKWKPSPAAMIFVVASSMPFLLPFVWQPTHADWLSLGPLVSGGEIFRIFSGIFLNPPRFAFVVACIWFLAVGGVSCRVLGWRNQLWTMFLGVLVGGIIEAHAAAGLSANGWAYGITALTATTFYDMRRRWTEIPLKYRHSLTWWLGVMALLVIVWVLGHPAQVIYWGHGGIHLLIFIMAGWLGPRFTRWRFRDGFVGALLLLVLLSTLWRMDPAASASRMASSYSDHHHPFNTWLWRQAIRPAASEDHLLWVAEMAQKRSHNHHGDVAAAAQGVALWRLKSPACTDAFWQAAALQPHATYTTMLADALSRYAPTAGEARIALFRQSAGGRVEVTIDYRLQGSHLLGFRDNQDNAIWVLVHCAPGCETPSITIPERLASSITSPVVTIWRGPPYLDPYANECRTLIQVPDPRALSWLQAD